MEIQTRYNIGDIIVFEGVHYKIVSVHVYESLDTHTERYYLGNNVWFTLGKGEHLCFG